MILKHLLTFIVRGRTATVLDSAQSAAKHTPGEYNLYVYERTDDSEFIISLCFGLPTPDELNIIHIRNDQVTTIVSGNDGLNETYSTHGRIVDAVEDSGGKNQQGQTLTTSIDVEFNTINSTTEHPGVKLTVGSKTSGATAFLTGKQTIHLIETLLPYMQMSASGLPTHSDYPLKVHPDGTLETTGEIRPY